MTLASVPARCTLTPAARRHALPDNYDVHGDDMNCMEAIADVSILTGSLTDSSPRNKRATCTLRVVH